MNGAVSTYSRLKIDKTVSEFRWKLTRGAPKERAAGIAADGPSQHPVAPVTP